MAGRVVGSVYTHIRPTARRLPLDGAPRRCRHPRDPVGNPSIRPPVQSAPLNRLPSLTMLSTSAESATRTRWWLLAAAAAPVMAVPPRRGAATARGRGATGLFWAQPAVKALMAVLLAVAALAHPIARERRWLLGALLFSAAGDFLLAIPWWQPSFVGGLSAFLLAHLCFLGALVPLAAPTRRPVAVALVVVAACVGLLVWFWRQLSADKLTIPVTVYMTVLAAMVCAALMARRRCSPRSSALLVHTMAYAGFFEDPITWVLLAARGVAGHGPGPRPDIGSSCVGVPAPPGDDRRRLHGGEHPLEADRGCAAAALHALPDQGRLRRRRADVRRGRLRSASSSASA